jgi:hypothetical protein
MMNNQSGVLSGEGDNTEQHEPLLSESQDDSLTLLDKQSSITTSDDKNGSIININDDLDESATPLLGNDQREVRKKYLNANLLPFNQLNDSLIPILK